MTHTQKLEVLSIFSLAKKEYRKLCKLKKTLYCQQTENNLILQAESTCYKILQIDNSKYKYVEMDVSLQEWEENFNRLLNQIKSI
jgi:hypothetical protein